MNEKHSVFNSLLASKILDIFRQISTVANFKSD